MSLERTSTALSRQCAQLTGATRSLGSHLVEQFAIHPDVHTVVCGKRRDGVEANARQQQAWAVSNFDGILSWVTVNDVAATLSDLTAHAG
ncbi:hypothetical protein BDW66DRAFT_147998 [Aspergillus desertorum]